MRRCPPALRDWGSIAGVETGLKRGVQLRPRSWRGKSRDPRPGLGHHSNLVPWRGGPDKEDVGRRDVWREGTGCDPCAAPSRLPLWTGTDGVRGARGRALGARRGSWARTSLGVWTGSGGAVPFGGAEGFRGAGGGPGQEAFSWLQAVLSSGLCRLCAR